MIKNISMICCSLALASMMDVGAMNPCWQQGDNYLFHGNLPNVVLQGLINAVQIDDVDSVAHIVEHLQYSQNIDARDRNGLNALMHAAKNGRYQCVEILLSHFNVDARDGNGLNALMHAAENGRYQCVEILLPHLNIDARDNAGLNALMHAASRGYIGVVDLLLQHHANIDAIDNAGLNALAHAYGNIGIIDLILRRYIYIDMNNPIKRDKLLNLIDQYSGARPKLLGISSPMDEYPADMIMQSVLMYAAINNDVDAARAVFRHASINKQDANGCIALYYATNYNNTEIIEFFLENSDVYTSHIYNRLSLLKFAVENGYDEVAKYIRQQVYLRIHERDADGLTALKFAVKKGYDEVAKYILQLEIETDEANDDKSSALMLAISNEDRSIIELFLLKNVNVNFVQNSTGNTPLLLAVERGYMSGVKILVKDKRVDVRINETNKNDRNALMLAIENGRADIVKLLLEYYRPFGANLNSALEYARRNNDIEVVNRILLHRYLVRRARARAHASAHMQDLLNADPMQLLALDDD